jgi:hypothetical protein
VKNLSPIVQELTYINYACNRDYAPHVEPERWGRIYGDVREMEARYQAEKAINKAKGEAEAA